MIQTLLEHSALLRDMRYCTSVRMVDVESFHHAERDVCSRRRERHFAASIYTSQQRTLFVEMDNRAYKHKLTAPKTRSNLRKSSAGRTRPQSNHSPNLSLACRELSTGRTRLRRGKTRAPIFRVLHTTFLNAYKKLVRKQ